MKVKATENGFYGSYRVAGAVFEVDDKATGSWFTPLEPVAKDKKARGNKANGGNADDTSKPNESLV